MWLYATGSGEIVHSDLILLADGLYGIYNETLLTVTSTANVLERVQVVLWFGGEEFTAFSTELGTTGDIGGLLTPAQVAACISWPLAFHYRGGHPRTYLAGLPASAYGSNTTWDVDWRNDAETAARSFHMAVETLGPIGGMETIEHGVVSFVLDGAWRTPPVFRRIQTDAHVDSRIDTQRRRLGADRS